MLNELDSYFLPFIAALAGGALVFMIILMIAFYVYFALALMKIAERTKTKDSWMAWVPVANVFLLIRMARQPWWHIFALLIYLIPVVGSIASLVFYIFWWWKVAERIKRPGWTAILMAIPLVNLVMLGIYAWQK